MSVTMSAPLQLDDRTWRLSWSSGLEAPTFYVWRDGELVAVTTAGSMDFAAAAGEAPLVAVFDTAAEIPRAFPGRLMLCWYAAAAAAHYRIEEYSGGSWTLRAKVPDRGQGYFRWRSRWLEDGATHQFRILPVGTNGNQGAALAFAALMVRHPDPPEVAYAYDDDTGKVTISAA